MPARIMVTGVPGVGKSSVCRHLRMPPTINALDFGQLMYSEGRREGILTGRDDLHHLGLNDRMMLQRKVVETVRSRSDDTTVVVDGHLLVDTDAGFVAGFPADQIEIVDLHAIAVLIADPKDVLTRREKRGDFTSRPVPNLVHVRVHQDLTLNAALFYALQHRVRIVVIPNDNDELGRTVTEFLKAIDDLVE